MNRSIAGYIISCVVWCLPLGCVVHDTTNQPMALVESSIAVEILLGGQLEEQPATTDFHKDPSNEANRHL